MNFTLIVITGRQICTTVRICFVESVLDLQVREKFLTKFCEVSFLFELNSLWLCAGIYLQDLSGISYEIGDLSNLVFLVKLLWIMRQINWHSNMNLQVLKLVLYLGNLSKKKKSVLLNDKILRFKIWCSKAVVSE